MNRKVETIADRHPHPANVEQLRDHEPAEEGFHLDVEQGDDPLLRCLIAITSHHDRKASEVELTGGLPLKNGCLTPDLAVRAAERAGYAAKVIKKPLQRINPLVFPAILLLENGDACVVFKKLRWRRFEIYDPNTGTMTQAKLGLLKKSYTGIAILVKPDVQLAKREPEAVKLTRGHWFWSVVWRLWPSYLQVIVTASIINVLALASPLFIMNPHPGRWCSPRSSR